MPMTASDILGNADAFRRCYPHWPGAEPEQQIAADSPAALDDEAEQLAREERWT